MRKRRHVFVHIGIEKTGSTSVQRFLSSNASIMQKQGFYSPASLGENHTGLCALAQSTNPVFKTVWNQLGISDEGAHQKYVEEKLASLIEEIDHLPQNVETILFSSEFLHSNLTERSELQRLRDILYALFEQVSITVYLRRQDQIALSLFSTRIKGGEAIEQAIFPHLEKDSLPYYWDLEAILSNYSLTFGRENLSIKIFDSNRLVNGSIIDDYCFSVGLRLEEDFTIPLRLNESLSVPALKVLSLLNPFIPPFLQGAIWNQDREFLVEILEENFPSKLKIASREAASRFYEIFRESNENVRRTFLPHHEPPLFFEDFDSYPTDSPSLSPEPHQLAEVFSCLWRAQSKTRRQLIEELTQMQACLD